MQHDIEIPQFRSERDPEQYEQRRASIVAGLRKLADLFEHPDTKVIPGYITVTASEYDSIGWVEEAQRAEAVRRFLVAASQAMRFDRPEPGTIEKVATDYAYGWRRDMAPADSLYPVVFTALADPSITCTFEDTDEVEEKEELVLPAEVREQYTVKTSVPKKKRVCVRIGADEAFEGVE